MTAREVELSGGAPWGFRMHGGADQNQPLRISRVNPGRKASLCGIREGDVISSINGRTTRSMSNADAHAMLRSAGPMLRLGLNEDRDMSPRRRSIGKGSELKRPSQLISDMSGRATPQAPVYATIRPSHSPQHRPSSRSSLNSLPGTLNSTSLVKSVADEQPRFHPTNPFYTTLPANHSGASKLPIPNGRPKTSTLDRNKSKESPFNEYSDLKSPTFFTKTLDSGPKSLPYSTYSSENTNGHEPTSSDKNNYFHRFDQYNQSLPEDDKTKNPFETKRNSDPFEKYLRLEHRINGDTDDVKTIPSSMSDSDFRSLKEIKSSTITEHKISEIEEVKTIKKLILNGDEGYHDRYNSTMNGKVDVLSVDGKHGSSQSPRKERIVPTILQRNEPFSARFDQTGMDQRNFTSSTSHPSREENKHSVETSPGEVVTEKPPVITPSPTVPSPSTKRE